MVSKQAQAEALWSQAIFEKKPALGGKTSREPNCLLIFGQRYISAPNGSQHNPGRRW